MGMVIHQWSPGLERSGPVALRGREERKEAGFEIKPSDIQVLKSIVSKEG